MDGPVNLTGPGDVEELACAFPSGPRPRRSFAPWSPSRPGAAPGAAWTVEPTAGAVVLDIRSADEGIATFHTMFR
jgi:hypothetical protein